LSWQDRFIAVDWGTTNRRAYLIEDGRVTDELADNRGMLTIAPGGFSEAADEITERLGPANMLLAGMVGSNRGWADAGYADVPSGIADVAAALHWIVPDRIAIVPGVRLAGEDRYDVMRGEEVQAFGAVAAGKIDPDALICHPGTHAKWIQMGGGRIVDFVTAMTGELFSTLSKHGILATQMGAEVTIGGAFLAGVDLALRDRPLAEALFEVRSRKLAGQLEDRDAPSFLSGLLIGSDVAAHRQSTQISLLGREDLCALYAAAIAHAGGTSVSVDGAEAFVAGMIAIRDRLL
jgi:2-dehydro-3-deoxygalactonokinase